MKAKFCEANSFFFRAVSERDRERVPLSLSVGGRRTDRHIPGLEGMTAGDLSVPRPNASGDGGPVSPGDEKSGSWGSPMKNSSMSQGGAAGTNKTLTGDQLMPLSALRSRYGGEAASPATPFSSYSYNASHIPSDSPSNGAVMTPGARRTSPGGGVGGGGGGYTPSFEALDTRLLDTSAGYRSDRVPTRSAMRDGSHQKGYKLSFASSVNSPSIAGASMSMARSDGSPASGRTFPPAPLSVRDDLGDADVGIELADGDGGDGAIVVRSVVANGSAHRQGSIKAGDRLLMVNGLSVVGKSAEVVQRALGGYAGSSVKLMLTRPPVGGGDGDDGKVVQVIKKDPPPTSHIWIHEALDRKV